MRNRVAVVVLLAFLGACGDDDDTNGGAADAGPDAMTPAQRGAYLVNTVMLCIDCHTPEVQPNTFVLDFTRSYAGGRVFPKGALGLLDASYPDFIMTRNLTPDATGLMGWTRDQIKNSIAIGKDTEGKAVCAATHGGAISPYAALEPQDLEDIVEYIYNLPAVVNDTVTCQAPGCGNCQGPPVQQ